MKELFNKELFGQTLHLHRTLKGHTLDAVSVMTGISLATLQRYEKGSVNLSIEKVMILCHTYLKMPIDTFTTQNGACPSNVLIHREFHTFTSMTQHLTLFELLTLSRVLKQYKNIATLFDAIKNNTFYDEFEKIKKENI